MTAGLQPDIVQYQHPAMARARELEERLEQVLKSQLAAELEVIRLQRIAAALEADLADLKRAVLLRRVHRCSQPQPHMRPADKADHSKPNKSDRGCRNSLDTSAPQSDEWCAARAASHSTERGYR